MLRRQIPTIARRLAYGDAHETLDELRAAGHKLRDAIPAVYSGYARMSAAAMSDGELPAKVKELIALAIAAAPA